ETIANYSINMTTGAGGSSEIQQYIGNGGSLVVRGNANIGTGPVTSGYVMLRGYQSGALANVTGTITFYGNVSVGDGYATSSPQTSNVSKVIFDGSGTQNVSTGATYGFDFQTNYIQIGSANTPTVSFNGPNSWGIYGATPTLEVNNNAILNTNSYLIIKDGYCSNLTCSNYIWGAGGTIVLDPGSQFRLSGATGGQTGSNFPINFTTYTFAPTSTVEYYGGNQTVYATPTYGNLTISTTGTKTAGAGLNLDGTVTINTPATFAASTFTHNVAGSWVNNGTFTQGTSTVIFDGTSDAVVSGTNTFNNLTISKGASTQVVTLQNNTAVNATLNMSMGDLALGSNTLTVGSSSSSTGSITNGSANSFIIAYDNGSGSIGRVKRFVASTASTSYVFPIGGIDQAGTAFVYTPLTYTHVSGTAASTANIQVYTKATKIPQLNAGITNFLKRYWDVEPSGITSPNYNITYTYQTADVQGDQGQFAPIKYSSPDWYRPTNTDFTTGTPQGQASSVSANTLTWSGLTSFSQFSAAGNQASALPVELVSFQANCLESNTVDVTWSTASEHNSNYFRVDKSRNGTEWDVLGTIGAAENSQTLIDYSLTDYSPNPGINYYRLFQYDMDGTFTTYDIQAAVCKEQAAGTTLSTHPNPSARDFNVDLLTDEMEGNGTLVMTDAKGSVVYKMEVNVVNGNNNFLIQNFEGQPGMYYITVKVADKAVTTKHSIR
ncbi:MAG: T9SS type A sorting domain-containing protein, partial [Cryomorphaceae bacterium]|nr:T9SS type A sorting domain-containing protein [Cryomorphaceae bacterium]